MAITREHELHRRRLGRNIGLGLVLAGLAGVFFALTIVKVSNQSYPEPAATTAAPVAAPAASPAPATEAPR